MATPKQALADLEKNKNWPVYYLYGEEPFKIQEFIDKLAHLAFGEALSSPKVSFCVDKLEGASCSGWDVLEAIQSIGLFGAADGGRRLVIVREANKLKDTDALLNALSGAKKGESPWGESLLVLVSESLDARRKFHQWLKKNGYALEFRAARDSELTQWVQYLAKKNGAEVSADAVAMLSVISDGSLNRLSQEIQKAWLYAGAKDGALITGEHVSAVSTVAASHELIELVRAVLEAKRARALLLTEKLVKTSEDALGLVGFITWAIKSLGRGYNGSINGGQARIGRLVRALIDLDQRLKTSGLDPNALVEKFIIEETVSA